LDGTDQCCVEVGKILRGYPILRVNGTADSSQWVSLQERGSHAKPGDVPDAAIARVPVARDLSCVLLVDHRIEDRLLRQARRKGAVTRRTDQRELLLADRAKQNDA